MSVFVASQALFVALCPGRVSTLMSACQAFLGLGYTIGPVVGSALYQEGGFEMPLTVVGCIELVFFFMCTSLPDFKMDRTRKNNNDEEDDGNGRNAISFKQILKVKSFYVVYLSDS